MRIKRYLDEDISINLYDNSSYNKQGFSKKIILDYNFNNLRVAMLQFNKQVELIGVKNG